MLATIASRMKEKSYCTQDTAGDCKAEILLQETFGISPWAHTFWSFEAGIVFVFPQAA